MMLDEMIVCGREFERRTLRWRALPVRQHGQRACARSIAAHTGPTRAARAPDISASPPMADLSACHRFVGDAAGAMGIVESGVDRGTAGAMARRAARPSPGALSLPAGRAICAAAAAIMR